MGPGPSEIHPRVFSAMGRPTIGYLDPVFVGMMEELKELLRYAFQTKNAMTFPVSGPGSVGMEMCFVNMVSPGDKVIVCRNGVFGGRMIENVERCGGTAVVVEDPMGKPVDPEKVREAFVNNPDTKILAFVHAETSTGVRSDAKTLAAIAREFDALTIVDTVTSLIGIPVLVDEWGLDAVYSGSQTLVDAVSECMRYWVSNCDNTHMCVGSTVGPNIFVKICGWSTAQISRELKVQLKSKFKKIPNKIKLINCVGGGSSAYGFWSEFIDYNKKQIELIGVEAGGPEKSKLHAAPLSRNAKIGILHGAASYLCQNNEGQINDTESISAGLDYPGVSPIHCFLKDTKRARYTYATDEDALNAHVMVTKYENLNPSLEPSHAFAEAIKIVPRLSKDTIIIVNSCGDAQKDKDIIKQKLD